MSKKSDRYKNKVALIGDIMLKRFKRTTTGKHVINIVVNTKNSRNNFSRITVEFWNAMAEKLNDEIETIVPNVEDGVIIDNGLLVKIVGEIKENTWKDKKGNNRSKISISGEQFKLMEG